MTPTTIGAVFDCNVLLQAVVNEGGPAFACIGLVDGGHVTLFLSPETVAEAADVLTRPKLRAKFHTLTPERVQVFLEYIRGKATLVATVPSVFTLTRDPKDEKYINLAVAAGAAYLVTRDN